jgi:glycosyltransferase involved in cell wall biosynthesis
MGKVQVCVLAEAGLGGTGKAAAIYATELVSRGYDVDYFASEGPRTAFLRSRGVRSLEPGKSNEDLYNYIARDRPEVIHQHVPGYPTNNRLYRVVRRLPLNERPKIIETNVFGRLEDPEGDELVDFRMFVSMASAAQCFRRARIRDPAPFLDRHTVLYNPVLPMRNIDPTARGKFREQLGVTDSEVLAIRIGRPGHKWTAWECKAYAVAKNDVPQLRLFLMEPPQWLVCKIEHGKFGGGIIVRAETNDFDWLDRLYAAADLMIHTTDWGESFGYTIAEAMAARLPVITRSTPWGDNAQVELVGNGQTGFVCWSISEMARRLSDLGQDSELRARMGTAGAKRIFELSSVESETDLLEEVINHVLSGQSVLRVRARNARLREFCRRFSLLQRATSERFPVHPCDLAVGSLYSRYRSARSGARVIFDRLNRRQIGWRPHEEKVLNRTTALQLNIP